MDDVLTRAARDPVGALRERAEASGRELGLAFSSYFPLEVADAFDLEGAWLPNWTAPDYPAADAELQAFVCNPVRAAVEAVLAAGLPLGLLATTTGCDARLAMGGVFRQERVSAPTVMLRLPVAVGTEASRHQAERALRAFCDEAREALGHGLDEDLLREACAARQTVRERVADLLDRMGDSVPAVRAYRAALASQVLAPGVVLDALDSAPRDSDPIARGVRVLVSASSLPSLQMIEDLESLGAVVVGDDTCTGTRAASRRVTPGDDLLGAVARSLVERPSHGPVMVEPGRARVDRVVDLARRREARAVVFLRHKFCDPHAFEVPVLRRALEEAGIACLDLEVDREPGLSARDRMRVETLVEGLS